MFLIAVNPLYQKQLKSRFRGNLDEDPTAPLMTKNVNLKLFCISLFIARAIQVTRNKTDNSKFWINMYFHHHKCKLQKWMVQADAAAGQALEGRHRKVKSSL